MARRHEVMTKFWDVAIDLVDYDCLFPLTFSIPIFYFIPQSACFFVVQHDGKKMDLPLKVSHGHLGQQQQGGQEEEEEDDDEEESIPCLFEHLVRYSVSDASSSLLSNSVFYLYFFHSTSRPDYMC